MPRWRGIAPPRNARPRSDDRLTTRRLLLTALAALPGCTLSETPLARPLTLAPLPPNSPLRLLGGLEIDRAALGFGGISALHLAPDMTLTLVSDLARFAELRLTLDDGLRPTGLTALRRGALGDGAGLPLQRGYAGDAESLARLPDGTWLVGFERWHRIRRYRDLAGPGAPMTAPPGLEAAPYNAGLEALAVLADGRWLALTEALAAPEHPGATWGWIGGPAGWQPLAWRAGPAMAPVDGAPLPDGGVLVLERASSFVGGFRARLTRLPGSALRAGQVLEGNEILSLSDPLPVENWEGVTVLEYAGRLLVALVSDDNESSWQRSLFLLLELRA